MSEIGPKSEIFVILLVHSKALHFFFSKIACKRSTRTRRIFSSRDYYQSIDHVRKHPETKFQVLSPAGTYPVSLSKIEIWPKIYTKKNIPILYEIMGKLKSKWLIFWYPKLIGDSL